MDGKIVLIDGHSILNRAFYGVPDLTNSEGLHTNAVYGFLNIMFKILEEEKADHLAVAFDLKEPTFRHKMYDAYKGTRKPMPEELREQVPLMKEVLTSMNIPIMTLPGYEADDILGTLAKKNAANGVEVSVVSGDRDLLQLADTHIKIRIPKTSRGGTEIHDYYPEDVKREYQVTPIEFIDVKALMGDASDNIPGVPSIGEKTATNLIVAYGSIENAYAHLSEIKPPRAQKALCGNAIDCLLAKAQSQSVDLSLFHYQLHTQIFLFLRFYKDLLCLSKIPDDLEIGGHIRRCHVIRIKPGQNGLKFQSLHIFIGFLGIKIANLHIRIREFNWTINTDGSQFLAHLGQIIMLCQSFLSSRRLDLI